MADFCDGESRVGIVRGERYPGTVWCRQLALPSGVLYRPYRSVVMRVCVSYNAPP